MPVLTRRRRATPTSGCHGAQPWSGPRVIPEVDPAQCDHRSALATGLGVCPDVRHGVAATRRFIRASLAWYRPHRGRLPTMRPRCFCCLDLDAQTWPVRTNLPGRCRVTPGGTVCEGEADVCAMGGCRGNEARAPVQRACGPSALTPVTPLDPQSAGGEVAVLREELSAFQPLLALSMLMTVSADIDEILRLATSSMTSLAPCRLVAVRLDGAWWPDPLRSPHHAHQLEAEPPVACAGRRGALRRQPG